MKTSKKIVTGLAFLAMFSFLFVVSCKKKDDSFENITVSQTTQDNSSGEEQFDDVHSTVNEAANLNASALSRTDGVNETAVNYGCANVTIVPNPAGSGKVMTIDFGTGCTVNTETGKTRKGQIIVTTTGPYAAQGTVITTTFNNYYVNDVKVEGTHTVTNTTGGTNPVFSVVVAGKLTFTDGTTRTWNASRTRTWVSGFGDGNLFNDVIEITGGSNGTNRKGDTFTSVISTKLVIKTECWKSKIFKPVSGVVTVTVGTNVGTIDYGSGTCDNSFTITINGRAYVITRS